jgi:radical SAM protein with 4Fe4S-binding SPASM domain
MQDAILNRPFILALALNELSMSPLRIKFLSGQVYRRVCNYIESSNDKGVLVLTGGEPFLDIRLSEVLTLARSRGWFTSVDTPCMFQEWPLLDDVQQIRLRLFSLNPELHNQIAGEEGSFQKTMAFGEWLASNYPGEKILIFPVCRENFGETVAVLDWCRRFSFTPNIFIVPRQHEYALDVQAYHRVLKELCRLPLTDIIIDMPLLGLMGWPNLCPGGRLAMFIGVEGEVKPCPHFPSPLCWLEEDIPGAWRTMQEKVAAMNEMCRICVDFSICGGGCLANKTALGKDYYCPYCSSGRMSEK